MEKLIVVAAVVKKEGKYLIARRKQGGALAGYWEFPGGKVEQGEKPEEALHREIQEELNLDIQIHNKLGESHSTYNHADLILEGYHCVLKSGTLTLSAHDEARWIGLEEFGDYQMAPADVPLVDLLKTRQWPLRLKEIVHLRDAGNPEEALDQLMALSLEEPTESLIHYHLALTLQKLEREEDSLTAYERALDTGGLSQEIRKQVLLGLANSRRARGQYEEAKELLERGLKDFPGQREIEVFYAMVLHNLGNHKLAMEFLLTVIAATAEDPGIAAYRQIIEFYADKIDQIWG